MWLFILIFNISENEMNWTWFFRLWAWKGQANWITVSFQRPSPAQSQLIPNLEFCRTCFQILNSMDLYTFLQHFTSILQKCLNLDGKNVHIKTLRLIDLLEVLTNSVQYLCHSIKNYATDPSNTEIINLWHKLNNLEIKKTKKMMKKKMKIPI